jgi:hypothetical protein
VSFWLPDFNQKTATASSYPDIAFVFDGQGWTNRSDKAISACSGTNADKADQYTLFTMKKQGCCWLTRQRKDMSGIDYCD